MLRVSLFGAGNVGHIFKESLKKGTVNYYIDNNKHGEEVDELKVISFDQYIENDLNDIVVITSGFKSAITIAKQMEKNDFSRFIYWKELFAEFDDLRNDAMLFRRECENPVSDDFILEVKTLLKYPMLACPDSQVEFYFVDYFEYLHYLPIYEELTKRGIRTAMVTEPAIYNTKLTFNYEDTIRLIEQGGFKYYTMANSNAPIAITTQFAQNLRHYKNKKCHLAYGVSMTKGKTFIFENKNCEGFDLIMVNGEFYKQMIEKNGYEGRVLNISYPKYKNYFDSKTNKETLLNRLKITTKKPIIIYLPTYDDENSIQKYASQIEELRKDFFVVTRPHHCTWYREDRKEDFKRIYEISDLVVNPLSPLSDMAIIGDYAICDARSGVMNEISFLNPEIKKIALMTNPSIEQFYIDITKFVDVVRSPEELVNHLEQMRTCDPYIEIRKEYTKNFYGDDVEEGLKRAVDAIISLL